jgi:hypothetical protein
MAYTVPVMSNSTLTILSIVSVVFALISFGFVWRLSVRIKALTSGMDGKNLEELLISHMKNLRDAFDEIDKVKKTNEYLDDIASRSIHKVGLVRFNPFQDTGSDQSFALALLDLYDNGVVVSSIHGREGTRTYAKAVRGGESEHHLSQEESQSIEQARHTMNTPKQHLGKPSQPLEPTPPPPSVQTPPPSSPPSSRPPMA